MATPTQHALVVGGSSGIGLAAARRLCDAGLRVTLAGRSEERLRTAQQALGGHVQTLAMDASDEHSTRAAMATVGAFDHLVVTVGSNKGLGPLQEADGPAIAAGFSEKALAQLTCTKAALATLRKGGSITLVSAVTAHAAMPGTAGIAAVNAAVSALVPVLAAELRPIRVNAVAPGVIDTPWWDFLPPEQRQGLFADFAARTPVGRTGTADDVGQAIAFLVTNGFMDGHVLVCDGGMRWVS